MNGINLKNLCPACNEGEIFSGLQMNAKCPHCGTAFYREAGYFMGAMVLSYFAGSAFGIMTLLVLFAAFKMEIITSAIIAILCVLTLTPILYRYSRIAWIKLDHRADPRQNQVKP